MSEQANEERGNMSAFRTGYVPLNIVGLLFIALAAKFYLTKFGRL